MPMMYHPQRAFTLHVRKGNDGDNPLVAWSAIADCLKDRCRIHHFCEYSQRGKCQVQVQFLSATTEMIKETNPILEQDQLFRIGIHLVPLYKNLIKLYMDELACEHPTYQTDKGNWNAYPVYKEIRDTVKMIMMVWKDIGLSGSSLAAKPPIYELPTSGYKRGSMRE